jgi:hypothetical protein
MHDMKKPFLALICAALAASHCSADSYTNHLNAGSTLIANQLDHGSNTLLEVFPNLPDGPYLTIYYNRTNCSGPYTYYFESDLGGTGWFTDSSGSTPVDPGHITFAPGDAAFINPTLGSFDLVFTGTPHVAMLPISLACGGGTNYFLSRQTNDMGDYQNVTGLSPSEGAKSGRWNGAQFVMSTYSHSAWTPSAPALNIGEAGRFCIPSLRQPVITLDLRWKGERNFAKVLRSPQLV